MSDPLLLRVSLAVCIASAILLPLSAQSSPPVIVRAPLSPLVRLATAGPRERAVPLHVRDPFVPPPGLSDDAMSNDVPAEALVVVAVALGQHPSALIQDAHGRRLVGIGDALGGSRVRGVAAFGITLDDGRRLPLAGGR